MGRGNLFLVSGFPHTYPSIKPEDAQFSSNRLEKLKRVKCGLNREIPTFNVVSTANKILFFCFLQEVSASTYSKRDRM
jgi:hypothetical protein